MYLGKEDKVTLEILCGPLLVHVMQTLFSDSEHDGHLQIDVGWVRGLGGDYAGVTPCLEGYPLVRSGVIDKFTRRPQMILAWQVDDPCLYLFRKRVNLDGSRVELDIRD